MLSVNFVLRSLKKVVPIIQCLLLTEDPLVYINIFVKWILHIMSAF